MKTLALRALQSARVARRRRRDSCAKSSANIAREPTEHYGLVALAMAHRVPQSAGYQATRLGRLIEAGFDVPGGFVITERLANRLPDGTLNAATDDPDALPPLLDAHGRKRLDELWQAMGSSRVTVRSSCAQDGGRFPEPHDSITNVDRSGLDQAARDVYVQLDLRRSSRPSRQESDVFDSTAGDPGAVLVQAVTPADFAGVLFSEHPATTGAMLVEFIAGPYEQLIRGSVTPHSYRFGKLSGAMQSDGIALSLPPIDLDPLLLLGREVETLLGAPQAIEWAYVDGRFRLLQARDIVRSVTAHDSLLGRAERERARLLAELAGRRRQPRRRDSDATNARLLVQNELSALLPRPTPLSADLIRRLWEAGGSTDIACQQLGVPYDVHQRSVPCVTTLLGWTYLNREEQARRAGKGPGALASFRLSRDADALADRFTQDFLPTLRARIIERNAMVTDSLPLDVALGLLGGWLEQFVTETCVQAAKITIAAGFHLDNAHRKLVAAKRDPARHLVGERESIAARAFAMVLREDMSSDVIEEFLLVCGHRAPLDYELAAPRFSEDPTLIARHIDCCAAAPTIHHVDDATLAAELAGKRVSGIERACRFQTLKEDARHYCLMELAQIRQLLLAIDRAARLDGRVFQLTIDEVAALDDTDALYRLTRLADQRAADRVAWASLHPPRSLSLDTLERIDLIDGEIPGECRRGALAGARVAGSKSVTGVARVIATVHDIGSFQQGEILIARMTDPAWNPLFAKATGIVTEIGGWLGHAADMAREFDLPAIVGVQNACRTISSGDIVTLARDGNVIQERDRRDPSPTPVPDPIPGADGNMHAIDEHRRFRFTSAQERRALKADQGDRRRVARYDAKGKLQPERRTLARSANLSVYRRPA